MKLIRRLLNSNSVVAIIASTLLITSCSKEQELIEENASTAPPPKDSITKASATPTTATPAITLKPFSFTEIPFGNTDLVNPGRGAEQWHDRTDVDVPAEGVKTTAMD